MPEDKIGLYFVPQNEGDHLIGLPARDLTEAEVARYAEREPWLIRDATTPHPATGRPLYQKTAPTGKRADVVEANKAAVAPPPVVPETPAKDGESA